MAISGVWDKLIWVLVTMNSEYGFDSTHDSTSPGDVVIRDKDKAAPSQR